MPDHNLRDIASRCEAKLHGLRRTAEGAVISFVIHPNEIPRALMLDALGTRYMLAFVAIGDDEQPIPASPHDAGERPLSVTRPVQQGVIHSDAGSRTRYVCAPDSGDCRSAPGPECAGCVVDRGWGAARLTPKARYAAMTAGEQAVQRAGMLSSDLRFRAWAGCSDEALTEDQAADYIRGACCYGKSRTLIAEDPEAMDKFIDLETRFKIAVGELPEPR